MIGIDLHKEITLPTHYSECSVRQFEAAACLVFNLHVKLGVRPAPAPLGMPNFKMVKSPTRDDFKPIPENQDDIVSALCDSLFVPFLSDFANISVSDAKLITDIYDQSLLSILNCATAVLESSNTANLQKDEIFGQQNVLCNNEILALKDSFEEYPSTLVIKAMLEPFEKGYDIRCFLSIFFANILRKENDIEIIKDTLEQFQINPKIIDRNMVLLQNVNVKDLLQLYVFFCHYTRVQQYYYKAVLAISQVGKSVTIRKHTSTN